MKSLDGFLHSILQEVGLTQIPAYYVIVKDLKQLVQHMNESQGPSQLNVTPLGLCVN